MKKTLIIMIFCITTISISCSESINFTKNNFLTLNKIIYDYFSIKNENDSLSFKAKEPWLLKHDNDKVYLFNSEKEEDFKIIKTELITNHLPQYKKITDDNFSDFTNFKLELSNQNLPVINIDSEYHYFYNLNDKNRTELLIFLTQRLYATHLKKIRNELIDIPSFEYPVTDELNRVLSSIELDLLIQAYLKSYNENIEECIDLLKKFYSVRVNRWKSQNAFVQSYELSQEKILGLSFYQAYSLLSFLEEKTSFKNTYRIGGKRNNKKIKSVLNTAILPESIAEKNKYTQFAYNISTLDLLNSKIHSIFDGKLISVNSMTKQKAELTGFLLTKIYDNLNWIYKPETSKENFHEFLGKKLELRSTEIDSVYQEIVQHPNFKLLNSDAKISKQTYLENYNNQKQDYNLQIFFDHYTDDYFDTKEKYYINNLEKSILFHNPINFFIKSPWIELSIKKQGFLYYIDRKEKNISIHISPSTSILIDKKIFNLSDIDKPLKFDELFFKNDNISFKAKTQGELSFNNGVFQVKVIPKLRFYIEEEYWDLIEELNQKLIERGVPDTWLSNNLNNDNFKIYHSVVRHFTAMPEHQVKRGERDQNWYMRHFGVEAKIKKGADFRKTHLKTLEAAEKRHGIHYELLMAIMAIESDYANPRWRGNFYTFGTLVSQYLLLPRRQRFAVNELKALYDFSEKTNNDVYHFIGSFAGAAGWGQFIPTSMRSFFIDSNDNNYDVDIYSIEDTIHSISNYLNKHGLSGRNINDYKARYNAVYAYNHSDAYVKAVLYIYDKLHEQRPK